MKNCENSKDKADKDERLNQEILKMIFAWLDTIEEKHGKPIHEILAEQLGK